MNLYQIMRYNFNQLNILLSLQLKRGTIKMIAKTIFRQGKLSRAHGWHFNNPFPIFDFIWLKCKLFECSFATVHSQFYTTGLADFPHIPIVRENSQLKRVGLHGSLAIAPPRRQMRRTQASFTVDAQVCKRIPPLRSSRPVGRWTRSPTALQNTNAHTQHTINRNK